FFSMDRIWITLSPPETLFWRWPGPWGRRWVQFGFIPQRLRRGSPGWARLPGTFGSQGDQGGAGAFPESRNAPAKRPASGCLAVHLLEGLPVRNFVGMEDEVPLFEA